MPEVLSPPCLCVTIALCRIYVILSLLNSLPATILVWYIVLECNVWLACTCSVLPLLRESICILMQRTPRSLDHLLPTCYQRVSVSFQILKAWLFFLKHIYNHFPLKTPLLYFVFLSFQWVWCWRRDGYGVWVWSCLRVYVWSCLRELSCFRVYVMELPASVCNELLGVYRWVS